MLQDEQIVVAGEEAICIGSEKSSEHYQVIRIAARLACHSRWCNDRHSMAKNRDRAAHCLFGCMKFALRMFDKLGENFLRHKQLMLLTAETSIEQRFAHAMSKKS